MNQTCCMQILPQIFKIEELEKKDHIFEVVADKYCIEILKSIMTKSKSVVEITAETKIPMNTAYRRIQTLHDSNLVKTSGIITDDGKRLFLYKSKIKGIECNYNNGQLKVELIPNQ